MGKNNLSQGLLPHLLQRRGNGHQQDWLSSHKKVLLVHDIAWLFIGTCISHELRGPLANLHLVVYLYPLKKLSTQIRHSFLKISNRNPCAKSALCKAAGHNPYHFYWVVHTISPIKYS